MIDRRRDDFSNDPSFCAGAGEIILASARRAAQFMNPAPALLERTGTGNSGLWAPLAARLTTTGDMVNGFHPEVQFQIKYNAGVDNQIGVIGAARSGAVNSGSLVLYTLNAGAAGERMRITNTGNGGIAENRKK